MNKKFIYRSKDNSMTWKYEKFRGDAAIYAFCPECGFYHNPSQLVQNENGKWTTEVQYQYNFCPMCGEYLYSSENDIDVIWNERSIEELYKNK